MPFQRLLPSWARVLGLLVLLVLLAGLAGPAPASAQGATPSTQEITHGADRIPDPTHPDVRGRNFYSAPARRRRPPANDPWQRLVPELEPRRRADRAWSPRG